MLRVISPGLLTTVQDLGRWGWQSRGVSVAGPMDPYAHRLANAMVGNARDAATLEVTLVGPELECEDERTLAVAGGDFALTLDGRAMDMHTPVLARAGSRLRFGARLRGARAYVAVQGGIAVPPVLGSRATHVTSRLGGLGGRPVRAGDRLPLGTRGPAPTRRHSIESRTDSVTDDPVRIRVVAGPHAERFGDGALTMLQSQEYLIDAASNRMGYRLRGTPLHIADRSEMISEAVPLGALQVPSSGEPILLMADRQTTGGYPIVATAIAADIGLAGQLCPGDRVAFSVCTIKEAMAALIAIERPLLALEGRSQ